MFDDVTEPILVWPKERRVPRLRVPPGYCMCTAAPADDDAWVQVQCLAIPWSTEALAREWLAGYKDGLLDGGMLIAWEQTSCRPVATAGSLADSKREMFPSGGQLGYVATVPDHRRRGLGTWLCALATQRLLDEGLANVFLSTGEEMAAAIRTYIRLGYLPCLYAPDQHRRWEAICRRADLPFEPHAWPSRNEYVLESRNGKR